MKKGSEKHLPQLSKFSSFSMGIGASKFTCFHRAATIEFSPCAWLLLKTNYVISILAAKIGISPDNTKS